MVRPDHHSDMRDVMFIQAQRFTWAIRNSPSYGMLHQALGFCNPRDEGGLLGSSISERAGGSRTLRLAGANSRRLRFTEDARN